ncbi:hypothetical protein KVV02_000209 [Mortierella alpina]|uniref:Uncharacterized protein n=1 Tax=Mortierella alpina TaxID=64518 RepID=A0A9P8D3L3_MORAP|nr:hypothetical protein KVV02_000209 [Mortierella alpina]
MKFVSSILIAASSLVALASADMLQINNPTTGSTWTTGIPSFVGWSGNCNSLGGTIGKNVTIDLVNGPANAVRYVATLGGLDCTGTNTRSDVTVPNTVAPGMYSIIVRTGDMASYSNVFQINNPSQPSAPTNPAGPTSPAPSNGDGKPAGSGAGSLGANAMLAVAGAAATVAYHFL